jgi:hypothetical protein
MGRRRWSVLVVLTFYVIVTCVVLWVFVALPFACRFAVDHERIQRFGLPEIVGAVAILGPVALALINRRSRGSGRESSVVHMLCGGTFFLGLLLMATMYLHRAFVASDENIHRFYKAQGVGVLSFSWIVFLVLLWMAQWKRPPKHGPHAKSETHPQQPTQS